MVKKVIMFIVIAGVILGLYRAFDGDFVPFFTQIASIIITAINFVASLVTPIGEAIFG